MRLKTRQIWVDTASGMEKGLVYIIPGKDVANKKMDLEVSLDEDGEGVWLGLSVDDANIRLSEKQVKQLRKALKYAIRD